MVEHQDSLWNWGMQQLRNGLLYAVWSELYTDLHKIALKRWLRNLSIPRTVCGNPSRVPGVWDSYIRPLPYHDSSFSLFGVTNSRFSRFFFIASSLRRNRHGESSSCYSWYSAIARRTRRTSSPSRGCSKPGSRRQECWWRRTARCRCRAACRPCSSTCSCTRCWCGELFLPVVGLLAFFLLSVASVFCRTSQHSVPLPRICFLRVCLDHSVIVRRFYSEFVPPLLVYWICSAFFVVSWFRSNCNIV